MLQLFFWYFAVLRSLPNRRGQIEIFEGAAGINITGLYLPAPIAQSGAGVLGLAFIGFILMAIWIGRWAKQRQYETGQRFPAFWVGAGLIVFGTALVYFVMGQPIDWSFPIFKETGPALRRGFQNGAGMTIIPEFIAVWLALTLYTAAFIAEIVRAGIFGHCQRADRSVLFSGVAARDNLAPGDYSASLAGDYSAAYLAISKFDQEFFSGGGDCLSRAGFDFCRYRSESGGQGN